MEFLSLIILTFFPTLTSAPNPNPIQIPEPTVMTITVYNRETGRKRKELWTHLADKYDGVCYFDQQIFPENPQIQSRREDKQQAIDYCMKMCLVYQSWDSTSGYSIRCTAVNIWWENERYKCTFHSTGIFDGHVEHRNALAQPEEAVHVNIGPRHDDVNLPRQLSIDDYVIS